MESEYPLKPNSGNLISNIFKSYFVTSSIKANLQVELNKCHMNKQQQQSKHNFSAQELEIEEELSGQNLGQQQLKECLVICKPNSLEIFLINNGLQEPLFEVNLFANLKFIDKIQSYDSNTPDYIFILTENLKFVIAEVSKNEQISRFEGDLFLPNIEKLDDDLVQVQVMQKQVSDTQSKGYISIYAYKNELKVIPFSTVNGNLQVKKPISVRIDLDHVQQIVPLQKSLQQTSHNLYGTIYQDQFFSYFQVFEFEEIDYEQRVAQKKNNWLIKTDEQITNFIPLQQNTGGLLFTLTSIQYYQYGKDTPVKSHKFNGILHCYTRIQGISNKEDMYLLGVENIQNKQQGELYLLHFESEMGISHKKDSSVNEEVVMDLKYLGECSVPSSLTYLNDQFVFLGSIQDDGQLIKIKDSPNQNTPQSPYITIYTKFSNLGCIYCLSAIKKDSNQQLLLSTPEKKESLNIFQKSVSINGLRKTQLQKPIKKIFVVNQNMIFISFKNQSIFLMIDSNNFILAPEKHFISNQQTQYAFKLDNDTIVQVTNSNICVISIQNGIIQNYSNPDNIKYQQVCQYKNKLYISTSKNEIKELIFQQNNKEFSEQTLPLNISQNISAIAVNKQYLAFSEWFSSSVTIVSMENKDQIQKINLDKKQNICDIVFHDQNKILLGMSDGNISILYFKQAHDNQMEIENQSLIHITQKKVMNVGYMPVRFKQFKYLVSYFVGGNTTVVNSISSEANILKCLQEKNERFEKIQLSINNVQDIDEIVINDVPHLLYVSDNKILQIGSLETSQKYDISHFGKQIQKNDQFQLNGVMEEEEEEEEKIDMQQLQNQQQQYQNQDKIQYSNEIVQEINNKFVVSIHIQEDEYEDITNSRVVIHDYLGQEVISYRELKNQRIYSMVYINNQLFVGGENIDQEDQQQQDLGEKEEFRGSLHIFSVNQDGKIIGQESKNFEFPVHAIKMYDDQNVLVVVGQELRFYKIEDKIQDDQQKDLQLLFCYNSEVLVNQVDVNNKGYVMIADPIRNISVFRVSFEQKTLYPLCKSYLVQKTIQSNFYGDSILQGDLDGNLMILDKHALVDSDLQRFQLKVSDAIYLGEKLTSAIPQVRNTQDLNDKILKNDHLQQIIYGTYKGTLGILTNISKNVFEILKEVQEILLQDMKPVLNFEYKEWKQINSKNYFIDADIIKRIQDLNNEEVEQIIMKMKKQDKDIINAQDLIGLVDNLERLTF